MIKSIRLQNFFGFQDCTINLEKGENVLVGINGSGKSNFFKAIYLLIESNLGKGLKDLIFSQWGGFDNILYAGDDSTAIILTYEFDTESKIDKVLARGTTLKYTIEIIPRANRLSYRVRERLEAIDEETILIFEAGHKIKLLNDAEQIQNIERTENEDLVAKNYITMSDSLLLLNAKIRTLGFYKYFDTSENSSLRRANIPTLEKKLLANGSNLPQLLNTFKIENKKAFNKIVDALKAVNNSYIGVDFRYISNLIEVWIEEAHFNRSISSYNISDGTLRFLCLMSILYNPNRGKLICIDEPELGLHPDMINTLYRAIEHAAETSQVIISTHSAHLLDYFDLENIRVFEKDENNATVVYQYTEDDFKGWYESFLPGQMWRAGDIGGKRW